MDLSEATGSVREQYDTGKLVMLPKLSVLHNCYYCLSATISVSRMGIGLAAYCSQGTVARGTVMQYCGLYSL